MTVSYVTCDVPRAWLWKGRYLCVTCMSDHDVSIGVEQNLCLQEVLRSQQVLVGVCGQNVF